MFPFERVAAPWPAVRDRERAVGGRRQSLRVSHQAFRQWLVETIPEQVADLRAVLERWQPDVLVADASMWGPILVLHESVPIPVALASPRDQRGDPGSRRPPSRLGTGAGR